MLADEFIGVWFIEEGVGVVSLYDFSSGEIREVIEVIRVVDYGEEFCYLGVV